MFRFRLSRRRQLIVNKGFQFRFALTGAAYIVIIAICLALPFLPLLNTINALLEGASSDLVDLVHRQQKYTILAFVLSTVWLITAWIIFSLRRSHKIAGPNMKITRFIDGITAGNFKDRVHLRSGDELQSISRALNNMLDRLQTREEEIKHGGSIGEERLEEDVVPK